MTRNGSGGSEPEMVWEALKWPGMVWEVPIWPEMAWESFEWLKRLLNGVARNGLGSSKMAEKCSGRLPNCRK